MWITHFKNFSEFQKADFLLIFQHFYGFLLDIDGLLHYNQYAIFRKEGAFFMCLNVEKYVYLFI